MSGYEKDRHSRSATTTVNQPMKKGGAGVANWGSATDPSLMYDPVGHQVQSVVVAPAQYVHHQHILTNTQPMTAETLNNASHFPTLGGVVTHTPVQQHVAHYWGPGMQVPVGTVATTHQTLEAQNRQGVEYDSSHPRNQFAKKPHVTPAAELTTMAPQAIDWSQAGTDAIRQTMLHVAANPAVMGAQPSMPVYPSTPLHVLKSMPQQSAVPIQPKHIPQQFVQTQQYQKQFQKVTQARGC